MYNATDKAGKMTTEMINEFGIMGEFLGTSTIGRKVKILGR